MRIISLILASVLIAACGKQSPPAAPPATTAARTPAIEAPQPPAASDAETTQGEHQGESAKSFFDPKNYPDAVEGTIIDPQTLTATERQYGMAPKRDPRVTYQDGIVLMEHGDQAIREAKTDGMTFSFDAKAEHVGEFQVGKIIFATGRVVGRVGQVKQDGDTVTVKLAPVKITDIIKKGSFMMHSTFNPKDLIIYTAPDFPANFDLKDTQQQSSNWEPPSEPYYLRTGFIQTQATTPGLLGKDLTTKIPQPWPTFPANALNLDKGLKIVPAIGADGGIGLNFSYIRNGIIFNAFGQLVVPTPKIDFLLIIDSSGIQTFGIEISGAISLRMSIIATSDVERFVNVNTTTVAPIDITIPCPIAGVPLALSFKTSFNLHTKFAAKTSTLTSSGSFGMHGTLFAGYKNGEKSYEKPSPAKTTSSFAENVSGASVGINTVGGAINVRPMVGLGGFGFMTGVFLGVTFTGDIGKQASQAMIDCHVASGSASVNSGVGYQLPGPFVDFVNTILSLFTTYQMDKEGESKPGWGGPLFQINQDIPTNCAGMGAAAAPAKT